MGYFSRLSLTLNENPGRNTEEWSPRDMLLFRIDDLKIRLHEFLQREPEKHIFIPKDYDPSRILSRKMLRYTLPENLYSYSEVHMALMLAEEDLQSLDQESLSSVAMILPGQILIRSAFSNS